MQCPNGSEGQSVWEGVEPPTVWGCGVLTSRRRVFCVFCVSRLPSSASSPEKASKSSIPSICAIWPANHAFHCPELIPVYLSLRMNPLFVSPAANLCFLRERQRHSTTLCNSSTALDPLACRAKVFISVQNVRTNQGKILLVGKIPISSSKPNFARRLHTCGFCTRLSQEVVISLQLAVSFPSASCGHLSELRASAVVIL